MAIDSGRTRDGFHRPAHLRREDRPGAPRREGRPGAARREQSAAAARRDDHPGALRREERTPNVRREPDAAPPPAAKARLADHTPALNSRPADRAPAVKIRPADRPPVVYGRPAAPARGRCPSPVRNQIRQVSAKKPADVNVPVSPAPAPGAAPAAEVDPALAAEVEAAVRGTTPFTRTTPVRIAAPDMSAGAGRASRHRARWAWEGRYLRTLLVIDFVIGLLAGAVAFEARFSGGLTLYNSRYILLSVLLPIAFTASLAANRGYEKRYLFVGTDEYQRVLRAGLALTAATVFIAYATETRIARMWLFVALPLVTFGCLLARFLLRQLLHRAHKRRGACMRRVVVGHELAVEAMARQLRRERYHGLKVVGACLPGAGEVADVPILGRFDEVAGAVRTARADTVLSCPARSWTATRCAGWPGTWSATTSTSSWPARSSTWPAAGRPSARWTVCRCCTSNTRP